MMFHGWNYAKTLPEADREILQFQQIVEILTELDTTPLHAIVDYSLPIIIDSMFSAFCLNLLLY